jgi:hypothetical protein
LIFILPRDLCGFERLPIEREPVLKQPQAVWAEAALNSNQILFLDDGVFANQYPCDTTILGEHQEACGVDVEPPCWGKASGLNAGASRSGRGCLRVKPLPIGGNQAHCGWVGIVIISMGHIPNGFMQQYCHPLRLLELCSLGEFHSLGWKCPCPELGYRLSVQQHEALFNILVSLSART